MQSRRSFIGTLLGTVAGANFFAKAPILEEQIKGKYPYYMTFHDLISGEFVQAPGIKEITITRKSDKNFEYTWLCEELHVIHLLRVDTCHLHKSDGTLLQRSKFHCTINLCEGDKLKVNQSILTHFDLTIEELTALMIKRPIEHRQSY